MADRGREEFDRCALVHLPELARMACRLCRDRAVADDLVQETFLQAWKSFDRFTPGTNCRAWLYRILLFSYARVRRGLRRQPVLVEIEGDVETGWFVDPPTPDILTVESVKAAFEKVPEPFRTALLLVDVEQLTYREAADALDVPIGTVMSRLNRGRRMLRLELAEQAAAHGIVGEAGVPGRARRRM